MGALTPLRRVRKLRLRYIQIHKTNRSGHPIIPRKVECLEPIIVRFDFGSITWVKALIGTEGTLQRVCQPPSQIVGKIRVDPSQRLVIVCSNVNDSPGDAEHMKFQ